jgi:hypothetical protein
MTDSQIEESFQSTNDPLPSLAFRMGGSESDPCFMSRSYLWRESYIFQIVQVGMLDFNEAQFMMYSARAAHDPSLAGIGAFRFLADASSRARGPAGRDHRFQTDE